MQQQGTKSAIAHRSLEEYFQGRFNVLSEALDPPPTDDTRWYLGTLLSRFARTERFFEWTEDGYQVRPLATLFSDARAAASRYQRCLLLQHLGDSALFLGALFPQRYARKGISKDYFVGMGGSAYDYLAGHAQYGRHVFGELSASFSAMLSLVAAVCDEEEAMTDERLMKLYSRWLEEPDDTTEQQLKKHGIDVHQPRH